MCPLRSVNFLMRFDIKGMKPYHILPCNYSYIQPIHMHANPKPAQQKDRQAHALMHMRAPTPRERERERERERHIIH
jgi:hypothetical protein